MLVNGLYGMPIKWLCRIETTSEFGDRSEFFWKDCVDFRCFEFADRDCSEAGVRVYEQEIYGCFRRDTRKGFQKLPEERVELTGEESQAAL